MLELGEGPFAGCSETGVITVELLVVRWLFAVVVVRGADGGAGALVGAVREHKDLSGEAGLDDAVGTGRGQIVRPGSARENHSGAPSPRAMTCTFMPCLRCFCE